MPPFRQRVIARVCVGILWSRRRYGPDIVDWGVIGQRTQRHVSDPSGILLQVIHLGFALIAADVWILGITLLHGAVEINVMNLAWDVRVAECFRRHSRHEIAAIDVTMVV